MNLRRFLSRHTVTSISKINSRGLSSHSSGYSCAAITTNVPIAYNSSSFINGSKNPTFHKPLCRYVHTSQELSPNESGSECESESDAAMTEFLSRFVWIMRKKLAQAYPDCDKNTIDGMLMIIVEKVVSEMEAGGLEKMTEDATSTHSSDDFSEDLWRTVWEVSNEVVRDMDKEKKKEKMKSFLQAEEVKEMYRFAGEVGVRGDMLRELRFKWAREKMEESEFYQNLEKLWKEEAQTKESRKNEQLGNKEIVGEEDGKEKIVSLPKRHGKIKYKIYGLDLSEPKWAEVADRIHESDEVIWPQEAKAISGKCKLVADKILSLQEEDDPAPLLGEWISLLEPNRVDWIAFLDRLKERNLRVYFKIAELVLDQESFQANIRDYSKLIDALARDNRSEDAERILKKMIENGTPPDAITLSILVHMYCKSGNLERATQAFKSLTKDYGFQPDMKMYNAMIMAYVNANQPQDGESLMRTMETMDMKPPEEIYTALLRSFAKKGDSKSTDRIFASMQCSGVPINLEACAMRIEACEKSSDPDSARVTFDLIKRLGLKPDDKCTSLMVSAYEKKNSLDKALSLLLELEKDGFEPGVDTYTVLVDWLGKLELLDEAEQILEKISEKGEAPSYKLHVSLCDMYSRVGAEKKALQALGVLESKIEQLGSEDFERVVVSLKKGGFVHDARRVQGLMEARGFVLAEHVNMGMAGPNTGKSSRSDNSRLGRDRMMR